MILHSLTTSARKNAGATSTDPYWCNLRSADWTLPARAKTWKEARLPALSAQGGAAATGAATPVPLRRPCCTGVAALKLLRFARAFDDSGLRCAAGAVASPRSSRRCRANLLHRSPRLTRFSRHRPTHRGTRALNPLTPILTLPDGPAAGNPTWQHLTQSSNRTWAPSPRRFGDQPSIQSSKDGPITDPCTTRARPPSRPSVARRDLHPASYCSRPGTAVRDDAPCTDWTRSLHQELPPRARHPGAGHIPRVS